MKHHVYFCVCVGLVRSQTTLTPALTATTVIENVTTTTTTPSTTTAPDCSTFNTSTCAACVPGSYSNNGTLLCSCCLEGGMCVSSGACVPCSLGFQQPLAGQQSCRPCLAGFYSSHVGSPACQPCPPGSYSNQTGSSSCQACAPAPPGVFTAHSVLLDQKPCRSAPQSAPPVAQSPNVSPIQCPSDAFCPEGSTAPGYCMETFFKKVGDTCNFAPVTIALLVIGGGIVLLIVILLIMRRRRDTDNELLVSRAPLLRRNQPAGRLYGVLGNAEPVYAGW
ncbi:hypothetical protein P4O66_011983 [Electrophorus voltai]|uniref:Tyrosine-protein kinase ephrin type A/B receptor-like domain-containing protein n=1 Tax=Electrophorus voltai TaxID=2609070 RepID=A0AAD8Z5Q3_9TELE|nr:hypothetical protein P4O66_011983 [Electrophorus voltai]